MLHFSSGKENASEVEGKFVPVLNQAPHTEDV
jgi:hypothetical protein